MVYKGEKGQNAAMDECKDLNAQLPLPKNKGELDEFRKITGTKRVWIGIRDFAESGVKSKWTDVNGNFIESAYVNLRVINLVFYLYFFGISDSAQSGQQIRTAVSCNQAEKELLLSGNRKMVWCLI